MPMRFGVSGQGLGWEAGVSGLGSLVEDLVSRIGVWSRVRGLWSWIRGLGPEVWVIGCGVWGLDSGRCIWPKV